MKNWFLFLLLIFAVSCSTGPQVSVNEVLSFKLTPEEMAELKAKSTYSSGTGTVEVNGVSVVKLHDMLSNPYGLRRDYPAIGYVGPDSVYRVIEFIPKDPNMSIQSFGINMEYN